ncbi:MAG: hypothetical protein HDR34_01345 [Treponema sp.]|nr:hypothetical protein [Treponema sp.]
MMIEVGKFTLFEFPPYFFFAVLGFAVSISCYMILLLISDTKVSKKNLLLCLFAAIGVLLGARLFGCLTNIAIALHTKKRISMDVVYRAGLVYYGGLFGGVFFYCIGVRTLFRNQYDAGLINSFAVSIPLFHVFGRLGCLFAGCCYGKEYHGYGHINYIRDCITMETFPVQLLESIMELSIFCFMLVTYCITVKNANKNMLVMYFILYSIGRFFMEFLRGDGNRGFFGLLSFSQIVSIVVFVISIFLFLKRGVKNEI